MSGDASKKSKPKPPSAAQIQADLEAKRAKLADTVDGLTAQLDPRTNLAELKAELSDTAANASEEAQAFLGRVQQGDRSAQEAIALTVITAAALVGVILIRSAGRR